MTTKEQYIAWGYTPYSVRHNIEDTDLAGLLDYLEREMGWEIVLERNKKMTHINFGFFRIHQYTSRSLSIPVIWIAKATSFNEVIFSDMNKDLFFATYKTLLPAIRNLYRK